MGTYYTHILGISVHCPPPPPPQFEADRRAFIITINSFGTELTMDDREKLYPTCGKLYPEGLGRLAKCEDYDQVKGVADCYPVSPIECCHLN